MREESRFEAFHVREAARLRLLVTSLTADRGIGEGVVTDSWLVARHRWPELQRRPRPELWLLALALRMLRRPAVPVTGGRGVPVTGTGAQTCPAVVLHTRLGLTVPDAADVLDLPADRVAELVCRDRGRPAAGGWDVAAEPSLAQIEAEYRRRCDDPVAAHELAVLADCAAAYLDAEQALRCDDLFAAEVGFAAAADGGFSDARRRTAAVRRMAARPTPLPEEHDALVAAAVAGDERAVRGVLDVVVPAVTRYCRARSSRLQDGARSTEDVAQDAVLAVLAALPRYRPGLRPFLAFVLTVANHKMLDAYRAAARRRTAALPEELELVDHAPLPDQRAECAEESAALGHLLDGLLPRQREILMMRLVFGMSAEEVASVLGTSAGAVRVAQHRALTTLRRKLEARRGWVTPVGAVSISEERST